MLEFTLDGEPRKFLGTGLTLDGRCQPAIVPAYQERQKTFLRWGCCGTCCGLAGAVRTAWASQRCADCPCVDTGIRQQSVFLLGFLLRSASFPPGFSSERLSPSWESWRKGATDGSMAASAQLRVLCSRQMAPCPPPLTADSPCLPLRSSHSFQFAVLAVLSHVVVWLSHLKVDA